MKHLDVWTDGSCWPNTGSGYGGWAVVFKYGEKIKEHSGSALDTTNNRMEMTAVLEALKALKFPCKITLRSDSQYVINAFKKKWIENWMRTGWKTAENKPVKNQDIWQQLWEASQQHEITWVWVRGHDNEDYNNRCDQLANAARQALEREHQRKN